MKIREIFDTTRDINRRIEKVISYDAAEETRLEAEVSEYEVTDKLEENFEFLLTRMQQAMDDGGVNDTGVWVSGFYGSGKSSFTKYLAFALSPDRKLGENTFLDSFAKRFNSAAVPALFRNVVKRFPAVVVPVDLGADQLAGATMVEISEILYWKVLSFIGYSAKEKKVAYLEMLLDEQGKYDDFKNLASSSLGGKDWATMKDNPMVAGGVAAKIAPQLLPEIFPTPQDFRQLKIDEVMSEHERVEKMLALLRQKSGKEHVIFVLDEVGQYVASRQNLILNLDGLARNLKTIGESKAWIIATAQQTLTEDNPHAQLNAPELYRLHARFPIQIDIEASDIKEICYRRLLKKSAEGEQTLSSLFDKHGQSLRQITKLENANTYDSALDKKLFTELYPFLPQHFEILLELLSRLTKSSGGIGLRSAIKIIQDVLVDPNDQLRGQPVLSDQNMGTLATTVTFYDSLRSDIDRSHKHLTSAVSKVCNVFGEDSTQGRVSKCVAILQILGNLPATASNIAALLHSSVDGVGALSEVEDALKSLEDEPSISLGQKGGAYKFLSDAVLEIEKERATILIRENDRKALLNSTIRELFLPRPSARLAGARDVRAGLKTMAGNQVISLDGDKEDVHFCMVLSDAEGYDRMVNDITQESNTRSALYQIFLLGKEPSGLATNIEDALRSKAVHEKHRQSVDAAIREYAEAQIERHDRAVQNISRSLEKTFAAGSFFFRGQRKPVEEQDAKLNKACDVILGDVASRIFSKYQEAAIQPPTDLPEKLLRAGMANVTQALDPLNLISVVNGQPQLKEDHPAVISVKDYLNSRGTVDGKDLLNYFSAPEFGWSKDALRYIAAAMLLGSLIKVTYGNVTANVVGDITLGAFHNNQSFNKAGIALRDTRPDLESIARAADRLQDFSGNSVLPLEDEIAAAAKKLFPDLQSKCTSLSRELGALGLAGSDRLDSISSTLSSSLQSDASDATNLVGAEKSALYDDIDWMIHLQNELNGGLKEVIREIRDTQVTVEGFPESGVPGEIRNECTALSSSADALLNNGQFIDQKEKLVKVADDLKQTVDEGITRLKEAQEKDKEEFTNQIQSSATWTALQEDERQSINQSIEGLQSPGQAGLEGLKALVNHEYDLNNRLKALRKEAEKLAEQKKAEVVMEAAEEMNAPRRFETKSDVEQLIQKLNSLKDRLPLDVKW